MKVVVFFSAVLCLTGGASAQIIRGFGSVVFPGGTSATAPVIRNFGSAVFPGSSNVPPVRTGPAGVITPRAIATGQGFVNGNGQFLRNNNQLGFRKKGNNNWGNNTNTFVYAFPYFVGGGYDSSFLGSDPPAAPAVAPPMVMYPPETARPVMVQVAPAMPAYQAPPAGAAADDSAPDSEHYLIAFKDHTVYSAVAYWIDGDTLHYFTPGNVHNQVSLSLVDRDLTIRLNRELGSDFQVPAAK
jgi:hypothetical protein